MYSYICLVYFSSNAVNREILVHFANSKSLCHNLIEIYRVPQKNVYFNSGSLPFFLNLNCANMKYYVVSKDVSCCTTAKETM